MQHLVMWITTIIVALTLWNYVSGSEVTYVVSPVDNRSYLVRNLPDKQLAADHLAKLRVHMDNFIKEAGIKRYYIEVSESSDSKYTSYTVNKNTIHMCVRGRGRGLNGKFIDQNTLFFVALHELAHVMTPSIGHTDEFWDTFKDLLSKAIKLNYYKYHPYHESPKKYCGIYISDTPLKLNS